MRNTKDRRRINTQAMEVTGQQRLAGKQLQEMVIHEFGYRVGWSNEAGQSKHIHNYMRMR